MIPIKTLQQAKCTSIFVLALGLQTHAQAAVTQFTSEAAFKAAAGSTIVHDFDSFVLNEGPDIGGFYQTLDKQILGIDFDNARVNLGAFGGTFNSPQNVVMNADFSNPMVIDFAVPQFAVGLFNTSIVDAERFEIFDSNNNVLGSIDLGASVINFGGFVSDVGITRVTVTPIAPTNGSIYIDDLTLAAVPEPATIWLLSSGFLSLFAMGKVRRALRVRSAVT